MTWSRVELQGPPPACRLDLAVCVVELRVPRHGLLDQGSGDLSSTSGHAKEVLERELKPGSASSRDSWTDVSGGWSVLGGGVVNDSTSRTDVNDWRSASVEGSQWWVVREVGSHNLWRSVTSV